MAVGQLTPPREELSRAVEAQGQYRARTRRADLLITLAWTSVAVVIALFLAQGATPGFDSLANAVTSIGILCGLVGTDLVLVMVVLVARVPVIDQTFGHDAAVHTHRSIAKPAFYLIVAHATLLILGYGLSSGVNPVAEFITILTTLPDMLLALIAILLFVAVIVSSIVAVRRRVAYEVWHVIHLVSYAAVALAIPHQLTVGDLFTAGSLQQVYWLSIYTIVAVLIAYYRFVLPTIRSVRHRLVVDRVLEVAPGVVTIEMTGRRLNELRASGGQFVIWRFWTGRTWWHAHPLSFSAVPSDDRLRVTVRSLGRGSAALGSIARGTRVSMEGPYGLFTQAARTSPRAVLVGAGIGVTPIRALLEHAALAPGEATVIVRSSGGEPPYLWDEFRELCSRKGATLFLVDGPRPRAVRSWLSDNAVSNGFDLMSYAPELRSADLYVCGPGAWSELVAADARKAGLRPSQLHMERFDW
jgi:predicted ferric reductase